LRQNKKGLSNIIVVVLSLVILVVIVANVILWSYQMNQLDWDRTQENLNIDQISRIAHSRWYTTQSEYKLNRGSQISGSYLDTQVLDGIYESFRESTPTREIDINGTFSIDIASYPLVLTQSVEIQLRYAVDDTSERWYLKAYNWTSQTYSDNGFNSTSGHTPSSGWNYYAINLTNNWRSYVTNDGRIIVKVHDQGPDSTQTRVDVDFLAVRIVANGAVFTLKNEGSRTTHLVSIWINNATAHTRYDIDLFINSGETFYYTRVDIALPTGQYISRVVTERGNIAVYAGD
jgi:hypothetical protein